jgi:hypothetical protein
MFMLGTAALGCPIERSSIRFGREAAEMLASRFVCNWIALAFLSEAKSYAILRCHVALVLRFAQNDKRKVEN